jgi:biotin carboxyl carrier protein
MSTQKFVRVPSRKGDKPRVVELEALGDDRYRVQLDGKTFDIEGFEHGGAVAIRIDGRSVDARVRWSGENATVSLPGTRVTFDLLPERLFALKAATGAGVGGVKPIVVSPMAGKVILVRVAPGDEVKEAQTLVIIEAMKMENEIRATGNAKVARVAVAAGDLVKPGDKLVEFEVGADD